MTTQMVVVMQIRLSTLHVEIGLPYEEAVQMIDVNKEQLEKYGSRLPIGNVGFYVRRQPKNMLGTGHDRICLVTGVIRYAGDGRDVRVLVRQPWSRNAGNVLWHHFRMHWKLEKNEKSALRQWNFWHKCVHPQPPAPHPPSLSTPHLDHCL